MTSMRPVPSTYPISQPFNGTFSTRFSGGAAHGAIDFATPTGTPIVAPDDGVIVFADWAWNLPGGPNDWGRRWFQLKPAVGNTRGGGGIMTVLRNNNGSHWIFAHLSSNNEALAGKRVKRGDIIGRTGTTGTSTGPHLHLGLVPARPNWANGTFGSIDPAPWLTIPFAPNTYTSWTGTPTRGTGSSAKVKGRSLPSYKMDQRPSPNYYSPAQVKRHYKQPRHIVGVTIHWWNEPDKAGTHDATAAYLARKGGDTSAHYVVSKGRVTRLVDPQNAAWHAGSTQGNATTIGIECDPRDIPGTLPTVAALIRDLEAKHGPLRIYRHSDWRPTGCPGGYGSRIQELVQLVNNAAPKTATATQKNKQEDWFSMATEAQLRKVVREEIANLKIPARGDAKGNMTLSETLGWDRHDRAHRIEHRTYVATALRTIAAGVSKLLDRTADKEV